MTGTVRDAVSGDRMHEDESGGVSLHGHNE